MVWQDVVNLIIRPERCEYSIMDHLGPAQFELNGEEFERADFRVQNNREQVLECSWFRRPSTQLQTGPVVIYCHGNCGSRCDSLDVVEAMLPYDVMVVALDFAGSGKSGGDFVTLGAHERDDVRSVVEFLRETKVVTKIALWGRSMGAVTALFYAADDPSIAGIVLDSPFSSLEAVITDTVVGAKPWIPRGITSAATAMLRRSIRKRAGFDLSRDLDVASAAQRCFVPCLFIHGTEDELINHHHSERLFEVYSGDKNIVLFEGDHNSERPQHIMNSCVFFLLDVLLDEQRAVEVFNSEPPGSAMQQSLRGISSSDVKNVSDKALSLLGYQGRRDGGRDSGDENDRPRRHHHHHHDQVSKKEKREKKEHGRHGSSKTYRDRVDNGDDEDAHDSRDDGDHQPGFSPPANFASGNSDEAADHHGEGGLGVVSATRSGKKDDERKKKKSSKESKEHRRAKKPVEPADDGEDMPDLDELKSRGVRRNKPAAASSIAVANAAAPPETVVVVAVADASAVADVVAAREVTDHKEEQDSGNAVTEAPVHASTAVSVEEVLPAVVVQQQQESHDEHLLPEAEDEKQDHSESFSTSATVSGTAEDNSNADGSRLVSVLDHDDPPLDEPAGELALE